MCVSSDRDWRESRKPAAVKRRLPVHTHTQSVWRVSIIVVVLVISLLLLTVVIMVYAENCSFSCSLAICRYPRRAGMPFFHPPTIAVLSLYYRLHCTVLLGTVQSNNRSKSVAFLDIILKLGSSKTVSQLTKEVNEVRYY